MYQLQSTKINLFRDLYRCIVYCVPYHLLTPFPFPFQEANYYGSLTQASTTSLGIGPDERDVYIPLKDLLPMLDPNDIHFDGEFVGLYSREHLSLLCF